MTNDEKFRDIVRRNLTKNVSAEETALLDSNLQAWKVALLELLKSSGDKRIGPYQVELSLINEKIKAHNQRMVAAGLKDDGTPKSIRNFDDICFIMEEMLRVLYEVRNHLEAKNEMHKV